MKDIETFDDIRLLVDTFYDQVKLDPVIGPVFTDVAKTDWAAHLPKMYAFWEFLLLGGSNYSANPLEKHRPFALTEAHFDAWVRLFHGTIDQLFEGPKAADAKNRSWLIAETWKVKFSPDHGIGILN